MSKTSDKEFAHWCAALKRCRYCEIPFYGPVCPCELPNMYATHRKA